ncbi:hypothetical protein K0M31_001148 [Melipona bicolor]|uniref:Uncharacterized protein n=1 Tax=Melipona bicolor TaxID=60889 RepID=A0AA40GEY0_9HYME|nr:hypothetical protein K0M31_001148 [Melipona bicolor]
MTRSQRRIQEEDPTRRDREKRELADRERKRAARSKNSSSIDRRANRFLSSRDEPSFQEGTTIDRDPFEISRNPNSRGKSDGEAHVDDDEDPATTSRGSDGGRPRGREDIDCRT